MYLACERCKTPAGLACNDLALYCMAAARMLRNAQLPMKFALLTQGLTCDSLANLHDHLATALHVNIRQSCEHDTDALCFV